MSTQLKATPNHAGQIADTGKAQPSSEQSCNKQLSLLVADIASSMLSNQGAKSDKPLANTFSARAIADAQPTERTDKTESQSTSEPAGDSHTAIVKLMQDVAKQLRSENVADIKAKAAESRRDASAAQAELDNSDEPANATSTDPQNIQPPTKLHLPHVPAKSAEPLDSKEDLEAMHTISMHMDKMPNKMKGDDMQKMIDDEKTPPDLKEALMRVRDNPALKAKLDTAGKGGNEDGCISKKDLNKVFEDPRMVEYSKKQSENYTKNYIPSDAKQNDITPREIGASDAAREMYLYSDSLPKHIDINTMRQIAEGKRPNDKGKTPPQVIAAAEYYTKHPEEFKKAFGGEGNNRDYAQDHLMKQIHLREGDAKTMDTMLANPDVFFKDGEKTNRDKLGKIAKDEKQNPEVREAANHLLSDPVLYGMLDNGKDGHGTNLVKSNNDNFISKEDIEAAKSKLSETNTSAAPKPVNPHAPKTAEEAEAVKDMARGLEDDPNVKNSEGGGLKKFGVAFGKVFSKILDVAKGVLDFIGGLKIPIISQACQAAGVGIAAVNDNGLKPALDRDENGTSVKKSQEKGAILFGVDMAATAASAALPGAGAVITGAAKGAVSGTKNAIMGAAKAGASEGAEAGGKAGAAAGVKGGANGSFTQSVKSGASQSQAAYVGLKDASAADIMKEAAKSTGSTQGVITTATEGPQIKNNYDDKKEAEALINKNIASQEPIADKLLHTAARASEDNTA